MQIDFASLNDNQLLLEERRLYDDWWRYSNKIAVTTAFGTVQGVATAGLTAPISGAVVAYHTSNAYIATEQHRLCMEEITRRRLEPMGRGLLGMMWTSVSAVTIGTACFFIPGSEFVVDSAGEAVGIITEAAGHLIPQAAEAAAEDGANMAFETGADHAVDSATHNLTEVGAESSIEQGVDTLVQNVATSALNSLHQVLDAVPDALLNIFGVTEAAFEEHATSVISATGELLKETAPTIVTGAVNTLTLEIALKGADSTVGIVLHRQSKQDMIKYVQLKNSDLDPAKVHDIVADVFARPVVYLTQYKALSDKDLLLKEAELIAAAAIRGKTLNFLTRAVATCGISLFTSPFDTISRARGAILLYHNLSHCRQELIQRGIQPQFPLKISVSAGHAIIILSCAILRELPVPMLKQLIPDEVEKFLIENISLVKPVDAMSTSTITSTWLKDALREPSVQSAVKQISSELPDLAINYTVDSAANKVVAVVEAREDKKLKHGNVAAC